MKIILSRKGFDSASGGRPSPIFADGRMVSLPIPDKQSPICYGDIRWQEGNLGSLVSDLTDGRIPASHFAHLDPDLNADSFPRLAGWRPIFGQTGAAQGHLRNLGVAPGDVFLFFGLFRNVVQISGNFAWDTAMAPRHVLWGWLQIDQMVNVDDCDRRKYRWAEYHPHFHCGIATNNTIYIAREYLALPALPNSEIAGAGVFPYFSERLQLTAPAVTTPSLWELPRWFCPRDGITPLTFHTDLGRWQRHEHGTRLRSVARGQEFILDSREYPEAIEWLCNILLG